ncbi:MAG: hypothetical protein D6701_03700, partial [Gemmatimonadetes bacterium]
MSHVFFASLRGRLWVAASLPLLAAPIVQRAGPEPACRYGPWEPVELHAVAPTDWRDSSPTLGGPSVTASGGWVVVAGEALPAEPTWEAAERLASGPRLRLLSNRPDTIGAPEGGSRFVRPFPLVRGDTLDLVWSELRPEQRDQYESYATAPVDQVWTARWVRGGGWGPARLLLEAEERLILHRESLMVEPGSIVWTPASGVLAAAPEMQRRLLVAGTASREGEQMAVFEGRVG